MSGNVCIVIGSLRTTKGCQFAVQTFISSAHLDVNCSSVRFFSGLLGGKVCVYLAAPLWKKSGHVQYCNGRLIGLRQYSQGSNHGKGKNNVEDGFEI